MLNKNNLSISKKLKNDFPWFKNNPKLFYFDSAATTLKPKEMINAVNDYYSSISCNPHNTDSTFTYSLSEKIELFRAKISKHLNAASPSEIIFTSGATESLNLVASGLSLKLYPNDEVVITTVEHSSNTVPWLNLKEKNNIKITWAGKEAFPSEAEIIKTVSSDTKILSFCSSSNIFGTSLDVKKISTAVKKINPKIIIVVDAAQTLPHEKIDLQQWGVDFVAASAHKMCGPTGIGLLFIDQKWLKNIDPIKFGGGMNNILNLETFSYSSAPSKFEGGTPNVSGIIGWSAAFDYLTKLGWDKIHGHSLKLKEYFDDKIKKCKGIILYSSFGKYPVISFNIKNVHSQDLANFLWQNKIIVRSGLSCAKNSNRTLKTESVVRVSLYIYNTYDDIDYLISVLKKFKKGSELNGVI